MANTAALMYEAIELVREAADPTGKGYAAAEKALLKLDETFKAFQEFEQRYNRDSIGSQDFADLERICRWCVMYDGVESRFDQIGRLAADVLIRHGVDAGVEESGAVVFHKVSNESQ